MKASAYELCLSIPTNIDTSIDSTVHHLLSLIPASLEAAWSRARCLPGASLGMRTVGQLDIFEPALEFPKVFSNIQPRTMV